MVVRQAVAVSRFHGYLEGIVRRHPVADRSASVRAVAGTVGAGDEVAVIECLSRAVRAPKHGVCLGRQKRCHAAHLC